MTDVPPLDVEEYNRLGRLPPSLRSPWEAPFGALSESIQGALMVMCHPLFFKELADGDGSPDHAVSVLYITSQPDLWSDDYDTKTETTPETPGRLAQHAIEKSREALEEARSCANHAIALGDLDYFAEVFRSVQANWEKFDSLVRQENPSGISKEWMRDTEWMPHLLYVANILVNHYELEEPAFDTPEDFDVSGEEYERTRANIVSLVGEEEHETGIREDNEIRLSKEVNFLAQMYLSPRHSGWREYLPKVAGEPKTSVLLVRDICRQMELPRVTVSEHLKPDELPQKPSEFSVNRQNRLGKISSD